MPAAKALRPILIVAFAALGACSTIRGVDRAASEKAAVRAEAAARRAEAAAASAVEASQRADEAARRLEAKPAQ